MCPMGGFPVQSCWSPVTCQQDHRDTQGGQSSPMQRVWCLLTPPAWDATGEWLPLSHLPFTCLKPNFLIFIQNAFA